MTSAFSSPHPSFGSRPGSSPEPWPERGRSARVEACLAAGGLVLTVTDRAARAIAAEFARRRRAEGIEAWATPAIFAWNFWVRERWQGRNPAGLMLLNPLQEQRLWRQVILESGLEAGAADRRGAGDIPYVERLAAAAQEAHRLLAAYAPGALRKQARLGWQGDAEVFSLWLGRFDSHCHREGLISLSRIALDLTQSLAKESNSGAAGSEDDSGFLGSLFAEKPARPPLLLIGFDRVTKPQKTLLDAWGEWELDRLEDAATEVRSYAAPDSASEARACVRWVRERLAADAGQPKKQRLLVVTAGLEQRRGELERALLEQTPAGPNGIEGPDGRDSPLQLPFEFSLGVRLDRMSLARCGLLLLRWLGGPITEAEVDWVISSGHLAASREEELALAAAMFHLRMRALERPVWELGIFGEAAADANLESWTARMTEARELLGRAPARQSPLQWVTLAAKLLETAGWPGFRPASSLQFQARERWGQALESCGSLGYDGATVDWAEFVALLGSAVSGTIFAAESSDAPVLIIEPLESAGLQADGIWFLGADEASWPAGGQPHALLPVSLQREHGMPHGSLQDDWALAEEATSRLLRSAGEVIFSYARQAGEVEARSSRLVSQLVGPVLTLTKALQTERDGSSERNRPLTESFADSSWIPFPHAGLKGGAGTLTFQSLCPFKAFGVARLNAQDWRPAEVGLDARQRGLLLHEVLHKVWAGNAPNGISTHAELMEKRDLRGFVRGIVIPVIQKLFGQQSFERQVFAAERKGELHAALNARFPARLLALEEERLTRLVTEWLEYERGRRPFIVGGTEVRNQVEIAGLTLDLRMDRVDWVERSDQSEPGESEAEGMLILDYKSGDMGPSAWQGERPDDVQLPLYATYCTGESLEGLLFARVRPGETEFRGRVRDAEKTLLPGLTGRQALVKNALTDEQMAAWRRILHGLAEDFVRGDSRVDPKDPVQTCAACHLHAVCRIGENRTLTAVADEDGNDGNESDAGSAGNSDGNND